MPFRRPAPSAVEWLARVSGPIDDSLVDAVHDVVDTLLERPEGTAQALRRFGECLGNNGWPMPVVVQHLHAFAPLLRRRQRRRLLALPAIGAMAEGWAAGYVRGAHSGAVIDPTTGLITGVVLRVRLREVDALCRASGTSAADMYCVVLIDLDTRDLDPLDADLLMACAADVTLGVFNSGETVARLGQRLVVLAPRTPATAVRVETLDDRLAFHTTTHRGRPSVVLDDLPSGVAVERYLTDLLA